MPEQQVQIFTSTDGQAQLEVALDQETVWLNQAQACGLERDSVCARFARTAHAICNVQNVHIIDSDKPVTLLISDRQSTCSILEHRGISWATAEDYSAAELERSHATAA
jgi:hypothetical protein